MSDNTENDEDVSGLKNKNAELHRKLKEAEARAKKAEEDAEQAAEAATSANSTELEKAIKRAEKAERDAKAALDRADASDKNLRSYRADSAISQALAAAGVEAKHVSLLSKAFRVDVEFSDDGEPLIGGAPVADYAKTFFAKDGLSYVRASENSGGGATGGNSVQTYELTAANWDNTKAAQIAAERPEYAKAMAIAAGKQSFANNIQV